MREKIIEILKAYKVSSLDISDLTDELLDLFPVMKCRCIHEIHERFPSELINKKWNKIYR